MEVRPVTRPACPDANHLAQQAWDNGFDLLVMHRAEGQVPYQGYGVPRGDGTRPKITRYRDCLSVRLTARHPDGRAFIAVWVSVKNTPTGAPSWSLDMAHRPGEWGPLAVTATELTAYVLGPATEDLEDAA